MAMGPKTARRSTDETSTQPISPAGTEPSIRPRTTVARWVIGLTSTTACIHPGIVFGSTKMLLTNVSGNITIMLTLPGEGHPAPHRLGVTHDVVAEHLRLSGVGAQERGQHADRGGLARPVRTEHAVHAPGAHGQVDTGDRVGLAEALLQPSRLDRELSHGFDSFSRCCDRIG